MDKPLVSILVPIYNAGVFLRQCLDSIIEQSYRNIQIILVDDGSRDNSWMIMQEYSKKDERIEIFHKHNSGVADTRIFLLEHAKGDFVLFVDSDDWIEFNAVEQSLDVIISSNADIVNFNHHENKIVTQKEAIMLFLKHQSFRGMLWDKLIKRELFSGCSFNKKISYGEDALIVWQILQKCNIICFYDKQLYNYRLNENSISSSAFSDKKFSAYYVWGQICSETSTNWPNFADYAYARYAIEMTLLLRDAAMSNNVDPSKINMMQQIVKKYHPLISKTHLSTRKMSLYSWLAAHSFLLLRLLSNIIK